MSLTNSNLSLKTEQSRSLDSETEQREVVELPKDVFDQLSKKYTTLYEDYSSIHRSFAEAEEFESSY